MHSYNLFRLLSLIAVIDLVSCAPPYRSSSKIPLHSLRRRSTFQLILTQGTVAPDGVPRQMMMINGQTPGPLIDLHQGDDVEINVVNQMPNPATIHFHGIEQLNTPWSDGVPGVSQSPIHPGASFVYRWTANEYGPFWYHSHMPGQDQDGLYGPIYVKPSTFEPSPFYMISNSTADQTAMREAEQNLQMIGITDHSDLPSNELKAVSIGADVEILCLDSILINGKGAVNCQTAEALQSFETPPVKVLLNGSQLTDKGCMPMPVLSSDISQSYIEILQNIWQGCSPTNASGEVIQVNAAHQWASLGLYSSSGTWDLLVSIDQHPVWVYAVDGRYMEPQQVEAVEISNGVRYSVMIKLDQSAADYTIRVAGYSIKQLFSGHGTLSYANAPRNSSGVTSQPYVDYAGTNTSSNVRFLDISTIVPYSALPLSTTVDQTVKLHIESTGPAYAWTMNGKASYPTYNGSSYTPLFFPPNGTSLRQWEITTKNNTWVDVVIQVSIGNPPHPIHKHSNKGFYIGSGTGEFSWDSVTDAVADTPSSFNLVNPPYRDTFPTPAAFATPAWAVLRYQVVNPGAFILHCHIQPHLNGGMAIAMLDGLDAWPSVPAEYLPA